jgi:hypothetical protein
MMFQALFVISALMSARCKTKFKHPETLASGKEHASVLALGEKYMVPLAGDIVR